MADYAIANQIRPFQAPDIMGIANTMQGLELNRMRSQQLQAAESERNAVRELMSRPGFDPMAPGSAREFLQAAPTTGAATFSALMGAQREQRQAGTAATETALKNFELSREALRGIAALPPDQQPRAWAAWRAQTEASVPGTRGFIPQTFSPEAYATMIAKADDIAKSISERPTALQGPGGVPVLVDRRSGTYQMGTEVPAGGAPAPRADASGLTPAQQHAAHLLRGFEDFRDRPYFDVTALRAGYGSDTTTRADGSVVPVRQGMTVSREDAERDLTRRIPQFEQRVVAAIGPEAYAAMPPNAQAALISIAYNYGSLPGRIRNAAMSGDPAALAKAVEGLAGDNQGINARRRRDEATMIAGAPTNAMAPGATPVNAMLAPPDATVVGQPLAVPDFARLATPRTMAEADLNKRLLDVQQSQATARAAAEVQRENAPARAVEAGQTAEATRRGTLTADQERDERKKQEGRTQVDITLEKMVAAYRRLESLGGVPGETRGVGANMAAYAAGTAPGQAVSQALGTRSQSVRNELQSLARVLITDIKNSTGMSAQEMNSNVELQQMLAAVSSPTQSIESVQAIIRNLSQRFGLNRDFTPSAPTAPAAAPPAPAARPTEPLPGPRRGAAQAPAGRPTLDQFLERARPANPNASVEDLTAYYNRTYGGR